MTTKANAEFIRDRLSTAIGAVLKARGDINLALAAARNDYDHNADRLEAIAGALSVVAAVMGPEYNSWTDYARNRS